MCAMNEFLVKIYSFVQIQSVQDNLTQSANRQPLQLRWPANLEVLSKREIILKLNLISVRYH